MFKQASKLKLRFFTSQGVLSVEQLWDLNLTQLSSAIKSVKKILKNIEDEELAFLDDTKVVDTENELRFNILKDIYLTKKSENEEAKVIADKKAQNQRILELIVAKEDKALEDKSIDELKAMLQ
jgi:hypothetical protein